VATKKPFVFLSNTGAKGSQGVQKKFMQDEYKLQADPVPLRHIWTASEAQMALMTHKAGDHTTGTKFASEDLGIPFGAKVFVMAGGAGFWLNSLRMKDPLRFDSWDLHTTLSEEEAKEWAAEARQSLSQGKCTVYVAMFSDGKLDSNQHNADHHGSAKSRGYQSDWGFALVRNVSFLLHHGARIFYTADDAFNPSVDPNYPGMVFPQPGPGMFAAMMTFLLGPARQGRALCAGKGGSHGDVFMMDHAIQMLIAQGHSGDKSKIMMIGDRYVRNPFRLTRACAV
jgi:ribonucleotide monophosphatase NagD (HAD superfamily)